MNCPHCGMLLNKDSFPVVYYCGTKAGTNEQSEACKKICYEYADFDRMEQRKNDEIAELERNNKELESLVLKAFEVLARFRCDVFRILLRNLRLETF